MNSGLLTIGLGLVCGGLIGTTMCAIAAPPPPDAVPLLGAPGPLAAAGQAVMPGAGATVGVPAQAPNAPALHASPASAGVVLPLVAKDVDARAEEAKLNPAQAELVRTGVASVLVPPGVSQVFPVSMQRVNRIVTPFTEAHVQSETSGGISVMHNVIYFKPEGDAPVSMFVTQEGDETVALNLTFVPSAVPPVNIELRLPEALAHHVSPQADAARVATAARFETAQPFVEALRGLMRGLAFGKVPPGFEFSPQLPAGVAIPACAPSPATVDFARAQYLVGDRLEVVVGVVRNTGARATEFVESLCGGTSVVAVAVSPDPILAPGAASEIYVVRRRDVGDAESGSSRPVLVP